MISYAENGRISGVYIVRRLLSEKLIFADESNISYEAGRHSLTGLSFSPEIRQDVELMGDFTALWKNVLYLYTFAEGQPYLRAGKSAIDADYYEENGCEDLTGITLLRGFSDGTFRIVFDPSETVLYADGVFLSAVRDADTLLRDLVRTIYLYAGETVPERILIREKEPVSTEKLSSGLSVSYGRGYAEEDEDELLYGYGYTEAFGDSADDAPVEVGPQVTETLTTLRQMMLDIDGVSKDVENDSGRFSLSFAEGRRFSGSGFSMAVPDGFRLEESATRAGCVMWLPNPENPDEWEASVFTVQAETDENVREAGLTPSQEGSVWKAEAFVPAGESGARLTLSITGVTEETAARAEEACRMLTDTVCPA